jgi:anti-sigma factor RsiW
MSSDIHALSGAYAVDALDDLERARFERHLASCEECRREVDELRDTAGLLTSTSEVAPPPELRARLLEQIATVRPLPPLVAEEGPDDADDEDEDDELAAARAGRTRPPRRVLAGLVAAAVALIVLGGAVTTVWHPWSDDSSEQQLSATEAVLKAADAESVEARIGKAQAKVVRSKDLKSAVIVTRNMPDAPAGYDYVLWFDRGGVMDAAGTMPDGPANTVLLEGDAADADGVGITIEREGELPTTPSDDEVAVLGFDQA